MKHPAWIAADIVDAVGKTRGQIIDWADEIERGITTALDGRDARIAELETALKDALYAWGLVHSKYEGIESAMKNHDEAEGRIEKAQAVADRKVG